MELIHLATLIHDDVLDGAEKRRDQPTANARWGNSLSVLLGDCLLAHALDLVHELRRRGDQPAHRAGGVGGVYGRDFADATPVRPEPEPGGLLPHHRDEDGGAVSGRQAELGARLNGVAPEVSEALKVLRAENRARRTRFTMICSTSRATRWQGGQNAGHGSQKGQADTADPQAAAIRASENGQRETFDAGDPARVNEEDLACWA